MKQQLQDINKLVNKLGELGKQSQYYYEEYKKTEEKKQELRKVLMDTLQAAGLRSAKTDTFTASMSARPSIQVSHEQSVLEWLREAPDIEADAYIGLKKAEFKSLAMTLLKQTGEVIPGTELITNESISVRKNT
jgi:hypothetical protein